MPIYEYFCKQCKITVGLYRPINECNKGAICGQCMKPMKKIFSAYAAVPFKSQDLNLTITDRRTGDEKILKAGNRQQLTDAINRYNDTPEASKTGKVAVLEKLSRREI